MPAAPHTPYSQFATDRFWRDGRIHIENGYSLFDYVGAIFSQRDFQPSNEKRLQEKLDTVIDYEERFRQFEAQHPGQKYFLSDTINACPHPDVPEDARKQRRDSLAVEIQAKLPAKPVPDAPLPQEKIILGHLGRLPAKAQQWLFDSNFEIAFSAAKKIGADGKELYSYKDMLATHPAAREHTGGGALTSFRPFHKGAIKYAYCTLGRDPLALLAHEALGHGLFKEACKANNTETLQEWEKAIAADLGDANKSKKDNPNPNNGRLGTLMDILASTKDDKELLSRLRAFNPERVPTFQSDEEAHQWLADIRTIAGDTWPKLGPNSWTYTQDCYRMRDGSYNRDQTLNEIGAIVGEQYFSIAQGKENALAFVIPKLTDFWQQKVIPLMSHSTKAFSAVRPIFRDPTELPAKGFRERITLEQQCHDQGPNLP